MTDKFVLRYFGIRGKAEVIRLTLEQAGIPYEDVRFGNEWRESLKKEYEEQGITVFGQVPVLSVGDKHLSQSRAIIRYLARRVGADGDNIDDQYRVDMIVDGVEDWMMTYARLVYSNSFNQDLPYYKQNIPASLKPFDRLLGDSAKYFVGDKWTVADLSVFEMLDRLNRLDNTCLDQYPKLKKFYEQWLQEPNIRDYLASNKRPTIVNGSGNG